MHGRVDRAVELVGPRGRARRPSPSCPRAPSTSNVPSSGGERVLGVVLVLDLERLRPPSPAWSELEVVDRHHDTCAGVAAARVGARSRARRRWSWRWRCCCRRRRRRTPRVRARATGNWQNTAKALLGDHRSHHALDTDTRADRFSRAGSPGVTASVRGGGRGCARRRRCAGSRWCPAQIELAW